MSYGGLKYLGNPNSAETEWLLDVGAFFDRFQTAKLPVLMSQDALVQALVKDVQSREWVDLQNPEIASALAYIVTVVPQVTSELVDSILHDAVKEQENLALRRLYFS